MAIISRNTKRNFCKKRKTSYLCSPDFSESVTGEMLEWLKRHAWKACILQKGIPSSNLGLSAKSMNGIAAQLRCFSDVHSAEKGIIDIFGDIIDISGW